RCAKWTEERGAGGLTGVDRGAEGAVRERKDRDAGIGGVARVPFSTDGADARRLRASVPRSGVVGAKDRADLECHGPAQRATGRGLLAAARAAAGAVRRRRARA